MRFETEPPVSTQVGLEKERGGKIFIELKYNLCKKYTIQKGSRGSGKRLKTLYDIYVQAALRAAFAPDVKNFTFIFLAVRSSLPGCTP
jgi:uncharacterized protein YvpB